MPRRPNYSYERYQRERAKAAKREAKRAARSEAQAAKRDQVSDPGEGVDSHPLESE